MDERNEYERLKTKLHRKVLAHLDLQKLASTASSTARDQVLLLLRSMITAEAVPLSVAERERLAQEICDEIFGLGPLEPLLKDPTIADILVNAYDKIYVERAGKLKLTELSFRDKQHLMQIIDRIVLKEIGRIQFALLAESQPHNVVIVGFI
jgi:pilus assembly protein CpaF